MNNRFFRLGSTQDGQGISGLSSCHPRPAEAGLPWIRHALYAVLIHEGLKVKIVDVIPDQPDSGRLVVEGGLTLASPASQN